MESKELLDWFDNIGSYFDWKELRRATFTWWKHYQNDREMREFHQLTLRSNLVEIKNQEVSYYINGLRLAIQDQVSLQLPYNVIDTYQLTFKVEAHLIEVLPRNLDLNVVVQQLTKQIILTKDDKEQPPKKHLPKNIFRTSCTSGGELCNLIIDSGSSKNLVSQEMIDKLKLTMVKHPQPYHIIWFNKGNEVLTSSKCLVNFSIGDSLKDNGCMPHSSRSSMTI
ncbi:hypothetical protein AAG906_010627 [Vitis piasezkii]